MADFCSNEQEKEQVRSRTKVFLEWCRENGVLSDKLDYPCFF